MTEMTMDRNLSAIEGKWVGEDRSILVMFHDEDWLSVDVYPDSTVEHIMGRDTDVDAIGVPVFINTKTGAVFVGEMGSEDIRKTVVALPNYTERGFLITDGKL